MLRHTAALLALITIPLAACREGDEPTGPGTDARIALQSEPSNAAIILNDRDTGLRTPDTISLRAGDHGLLLRLDTAGLTYEYAAFLRVTRVDSVLDFTVPLALQCSHEQPAACFTLARRQSDAAGLRFSSSAVGSLFHWAGQGQGLFWPAETTNSYASGGMPVVAGLVNNASVALGPYDQTFLAGRPLPQVERSGTRLTIRQTTWIAPPVSQFVRTNTARGLEVEELVLADDEVPGVVVFRLRFRNISNQPVYWNWSSHLTPTQLTYTNTYIGFILDPDVGTATDDWLTYDPALDAVIAYDASFSEGEFTGDAGHAPGLIGLRALSIPQGTDVVLNGWANTPGLLGDWEAGGPTEPNGYAMLTGAQSYTPDHPARGIGHLPTGSGDVRVSVTAGPLTLAPGQHADIVLALAVAAPVPGTFTTGTIVRPGEPEDASRTIHRIAAELRERLIAAEALLTALPSN